MVVQPLSQKTEQEITIRDARSAVMVESLFTEKYQPLARDSAVQAFMKMSRPTSVKDLKLHPASTFNHLDPLQLKTSNFIPLVPSIISLQRKLRSTQR